MTMQSNGLVGCTSVGPVPDVPDGKPFIEPTNMRDTLAKIADGHPINRIDELMPFTMHGDSWRGEPRSCQHQMICAPCSSI